MLFQKKTSVQGGWVKAADVVSGTKCKLITEATKQEGEYGEQTVAKIRFQGADEALNVRLNNTTIGGLVDAFGPDSNDWIGKVLTAHTEKSMVSGRRVTVLYLLAEGYELREDSNGYLQVMEKLSATPPTDTDLPF